MFFDDELVPTADVRLLCVAVSDVSESFTFVEGGVKLVVVGGVMF